MTLSRPKTLVPDTNILVDNLAEIKELAESGDWQLRVPTTVLVELEGLSKSQESRDPERDNRDEVRDKCHEALTWLRDRPANTRCVTTKGSILNNFSLAFEEDCSDGQVIGNKENVCIKQSPYILFFRRMMTAFCNAASTSTLALQLQSRMGSRQFTETRS